MSDHETSTLPSRIAALQNGGTTISGVAIGAGDRTHGLEGTTKVWPADELQAAADSLEGTELNVLHSEQEVGRVTAAGYDPEREAVVYEASLTDDKLAKQAEDGNLDVSIEARHHDGGETDGGAMLATDIEFTGLSVLQVGAAPSNSAEPGTAEALAAELSAGDIRAALATHAFNVGDRVAWAFGDGTAHGRVAEVITTPGEVSRTIKSETVTREVTADEAVYVLDVWRDSDGEFAGQALKSGSELEEWASPPEAAQAAALADVNGETVDLSPPEAVINAAEAALEAKREQYPDELSDCGTGVGEDRAEAIANAELDPADFTTGGEHETAIPDYLDSHSDDVDGIDDPPTQWDKDTWTDGCGPVQYALWGGTATGTGLEWAESTAEAVEAAMEESDAAGAAGESSDVDQNNGAEAAAATDDPTGARSSGRDIHIGTMTEEDNPDPEKRVTELKAELSDRDERIRELEAELESLRGERDDVARAYAETLVEAGESVLGTEDLVENFDVATLRERVEDLDTSVAEAAAPEPDVQSGGGGKSAELGSKGEGIVAELGVDGRDEAVAELRDRYEKYTEAGWDGQAEQTKQKLATLGVEVSDA